MTDSHSLDIEGVLERLPHRFPFLMVDRVTSVVPGESIVAVKNVSINEDHFVGHFPDHPVMPGVLVIEALAQASGVLAWESATAAEQSVRILYLVAIRNARFKRTVRPGDQLVLKAELTARKQALWRFECRAEVDGESVAEAEILMATRKEP